jgi:hypothetical protein
VRAGVTGAPVLAGALGWLECRVEARLDTGDRTVYLAAVEAGDLQGDAPPLTVHRLLALAPPDRLAEMERLLARDIEVDRAAIAAWRARLAEGPPPAAGPARPFMSPRSPPGGRAPLS